MGALSTLGTIHTGVSSSLSYQPILTLPREAVDLHYWCAPFLSRCEHQYNSPLNQANWYALSLYTYSPFDPELNY
jgi:hypothetical protein